MGRNFFTDKFKAFNSKGKLKGSRLSGVSLTALGILGFAGTASAQDAEVETVPDGFKAASEIADVQDITTLADGSVEITLANGETVVFAADEVAIVGGDVFLSETAISAAGLSVGSVGVSPLLVLGGAALLGGGAAFALGSGDDDDAPTPTPVIDTNDAPVLGSATQFDAVENQTSAFTATATDADGDTLTYTLSGTDADLFAIDADTGVVNFIDAPDFEAPGDADGDNVYDVTITASDGELSATQDVTITVTNENEAPVFTSAEAVSVEENGTAAFTATATDVDGDTLTYTLTGADAALFAIDAATGVVSFIAAPDFETPGDADGDNVYDVTVTASDGELSSSQDVAITVTDVNEAPVITSAATVSVDENGTAGFTATATDVDGDTLTYSLTGADAALFAIDAATGVVSFIAAPDFETPGDADGDNVYDVTVTASDGELSSSQDVAITVTDVNETPVITSAAAVSVDENQTSAFTATATDVDGDTLTYTLAGADAALFAIDAATGIVSFIAAPDFETPGDADGDNVYDVTVTASDGDLSASQDVAITVTDVDDTPPEAPVILSIGLEYLGGDPLSEDELVDEFNVIISGLAEADSSVEVFESGVSLGVVNAQSDGSFQLIAPLASINEGELTVIATDLAGNVSEESDLESLFEFDLFDGFEGILSLDTSDDDLDDLEDRLTNERELDTVSFVVENTTSAFVATSLGDGTVFTLTGNDADLFTVDQNTGLVSFIDAPDFETIINNDSLTDNLIPFDDPSQAPGLGLLEVSDFAFEIEVIARNGFEELEQNVTIFVTDENEFAPVFETDNVLVSSNSFVRFRANDEDGTPLAISDTQVLFGEVFQVFADSLIYEIVGGADADLFELSIFSDHDGNYGRLGLIDFPPVDMPTDSDGDGVYEVVVSASDGENVIEQTLTISFVDGGEIPEFVSPTNFSIDELDIETTFQISAIDPDGADIRYFLDGVDEDLFEINQFTGELSLVGPIRFNDLSDNVYDLTVIAIDGTDRASQDIMVTVNNLEFAPQLNPNFETRFDENSSISELFNTTDPDRDQITTSITGGADADLFVLVPLVTPFGPTNAFNLFLNEVLDFEAPIDANGDNIYEVEVTLSDGVNETVELLQFIVQDVLESPNAPVFTSPDTVAIDEAQAFVLNVSAEDADGENLIYRIVGGEDDFRFDIDRNTGDLTFDDFFGIPRFAQPDEFDDNFYTVIVEAYDGSTNRTQQTITVEILDVDVPPTIGSDLVTDRTLNENENFFNRFGAGDFFDREGVTLSLEGEDASFFVLSNLDVSSQSVFATLSLIESLDYENPQDADGDNVYVVDVVVSDGANRTIETVEVTIVDIFESDNAPAFTSSTTLVVDDGQRFVVEVNAEDADGEIPTYSIVGGEDFSDFEIDSETGVLSFDFTPDFGFPRDFDGDNIYVVVVEAFDGTGNRTEQSITVEVVDANTATSSVSDTIPSDLSFEVPFAITDDPSDNAAAFSVFDNVSFSSNSQDIDFGLTSLLLEAITPDFGAQLLTSDVFESVQSSLSESATETLENGIWTVKSVALETEIVSTEPDAKPFFEDIYSTTDEGELHFIADTNDFAGDVWM